MKSNCLALRMAVFVSILFISITIILTVLKLCMNEVIIDIMLNIAIGLFSSSFVALLIAIPNYNVSKVQQLEKCYSEARRLVLKIGEPRYLFNEYDNELVLSYINEVNNKEKFGEIGKKLKLEFKDAKYKEELIKEYLKHHPEIDNDITNPYVRKFASDCVDTQVKKIRDNLKEICQSYVDLGKEDTDYLSLVMGDIEFFSGKKHFEKIYMDIYDPIVKLLRKEKERGYHFKMFLDGEGNEAASFDMLSELQKEIFKVEKEEDEKERCFIIYNKFVNNMNKELETLRASIYGLKPIKIEDEPVEIRTYMKIQKPIKK